MKALWVLILISVLCCEACSQNQKIDVSQSPTVFGDPEQAAQNGLDSFKQTVNETNFRALGFDSVDEAEKATLGEPAKLFTVPNNKLADYKKSTTNIRGLIQDTHRLVYPVMVNGEGKTLITISQEPQGWRLATIGDQRVAGNLARIRKDKIASAGSGPGSSPDNYYDVRIQAFAADFLATSRQTEGPGSEDVLLTPLSDTNRVSSLTETQESKGIPRPSSTTRPSAFSMYMQKNPTFTPEGEASKPASDVLGALAPAAKNVEKTEGPS